MRELFKLNRLPFLILMGTLSAAIWSFNWPFSWPAGLSTSAWAQSAPAQTNGDAPTQTPEPDRGWNALADVLDALSPSVDLQDPPSGQEVNRDIQTQIDRRQAQAALNAIEAREQELSFSSAPGRDVQLMFQKARALAQLNRIAEAEAVYRDMTVRYPELAEPWNNLAILYISQDNLDQARMALEAAVMNNPRYTTAISNLADLRLLMALRDYEQAAALGDRAARSRAAALRQFLNEVN
jgi:tetratricopeptide (TPR) repeat protein